MKANSDNDYIDGYDIFGDGLLFIENKNEED